MCERLLANGAWISTIAKPLNGDPDGQSRFGLAEAEISEDYRRLLALELKAAADKQYSTANWAQRRVRTITSEDTLSFLSRKAIIPKYGFPVDVVELDTQPINRTESSEVTLQRDLAIAISEFAPTSKIIANKREWSSYALKKVAEREWPRRSYQKCSKHNMFVQWEAGQDPPTDFCCGRAQTFIVVPRFQTKQ